MKMHAGPQRIFHLNWAGDFGAADLRRRMTTLMPSNPREVKISSDRRRLEWVDRAKMIMVSQKAKTRERAISLRVVVCAGRGDESPRSSWQRPREGRHEERPARWAYVQDSLAKKTGSKAGWHHQWRTAKNQVAIRARRGPVFWGFGLQYPPIEMPPDRIRHPGWVGRIGNHAQGSSPGTGRRTGRSSHR